MTVTVIVLLVRRSRPKQTWYVVAHGRTEDEARAQIEEWQPKPPDKARWDCVGVETFVGI